MNLEVDIAEIKRDIGFLKESFGSNVEDFKEHIRSADIYREKVNKLESTEKEFNAHVEYDMWLFGVVITMNLAILVKIFT